MTLKRIIGFIGAVLYIAVIVLFFYGLVHYDDNWRWGIVSAILGICLGIYLLIGDIFALMCAHNDREKGLQLFYLSKAGALTIASVFLLVFALQQVEHN
ncbi:MAG: hypothetical protein Ta2G_18910 [Termitinemataceae bacterium]|nr:MAG: hypothetical protein Ta2G_18910 [Termitinemataceae bacterium]